MKDRERPSASDSEEKIPEAWIGQEVMLETTETLSSDLRASAPVYLEDVNDRGIVMLVTRHHGQSQFSRYFYLWSVGLVGYVLPRRTSVQSRALRAHEPAPGCLSISDGVLACRPWHRIFRWNRWRAARPRHLR